MQTHQAVNGVRCLEFRPRFEVVAEQHKGDDERCTVKEDVVGFADKFGQEGQHRGEGHQRRPEHGHGGAEVNKHVHVGRSPSQGSPGVAMEISPRKGVDRQGGEHGEAQTEVKRPQRPHVVQQHREHKHGNGEGKGEANLSSLSGHLLLADATSLEGGNEFAGTKTGGFHGGDAGRSEVV